MLNLTDRYKIKTKDGFKDFSGLQKVSKLGKIKITLKNGKFLECSKNHRVMTSFGWKKAKHLSKSDNILTSSDFVEIFDISEDTEKYEFYDVLGVDGHEFLSNEIVSHNCNFLGGANTLINPLVLKNIPFIDPINENDDGKVDNFRIFELPKPEHKYAITADCARGLGLDYSTLVVFDITYIPYKIVCRYRSNTIQHTMFPDVINETGKRYNDAMVLIELNDVGESVAATLWQDLEYENMFLTNNKDRLGESGSSSLGVKTTKKTKRQGCSYLKALIESYKLEINDFGVIQELSSFVQMKNSYEAEAGAHDDLVMCLVIFAWLVNQDYYKQLTDTNIRNDIIEDNKKTMEEDLIPFGFYDGGGDDFDDEVPLDF
jgi:hypothetical protein